MIKKLIIIIYKNRKKMAKKKEKILNSRVEVRIENVKIGDIIYLDSEEMVQYEVLDVGNPFVLILNLKTNFAYLYKAKTIFKDI